MSCPVNRQNEMTAYKSGYVKSIDILCVIGEDIGLQGRFPEELEFVIKFYYMDKVRTSPQMCSKNEISFLSWI